MIPLENYPTIKAGYSCVERTDMDPCLDAANCLIETRVGPQVGLSLRNPTFHTLKPPMKHMRENHWHKIAAAIAPGEVMLGFAGCRDPREIIE